MSVGEHEEYTRTYYYPVSGDNHVVGALKRVDGKLVHLQGCIPDAGLVMTPEEMSAFEKVAE